MNRAAEVQTPAAPARPNPALAALCACAALTLPMISGCSGGGSDDPPPPAVAPQVSAASLVANAGPNGLLAVLGSTQGVTLDGRKSFFRDTELTTRLPASFSWALVSQPGVTTPTGVPFGPTSTALAQVTFPATPDVGTYKFRLTATEGAATDVDEVDVVVQRFVITGLTNRIQMGFSTTTTTVTASLAAGISGTSGTVTFAWSGLLPSPFFKNVAGTNASTLTFEAPRVDELQALPSRGGVLGLWDYSAGYRQLRLTANDGISTATADVVVSYGIPTSGSTNVPVRTPVYLSGGSTGPYAWQFSSFPGGTTVPTFFSAANESLGSTVAATSTARVVWFQPKDPGLFVVVVTSGTTSVAIEINAAEYVTDGLRGTVAPNPDLGQCGGCHGGSIPFLQDQVTGYLGTKHASVADGALQVTSTPRLAYATLGFHLGRTTGAAASTFTASNVGFDDIAASQGSLVRPIDFADLEHRYPETARRANVQCEVCHGPGSFHFGDSEAIAVSVKTDICAQCHASQPREWSNSLHSQVVSSPAGRTACVRCHTAEAALDDRNVSFSYSTNPSAPNPPPSLPVPNEEGRGNTATCATCHDPHSAANEYQLRQAGTTVLVSGDVVEAGNAKGCIQCHNARNAIETPATLSGRSSPHAASQSELMTGTNGGEFAGYRYPSSPHAIPAQFVVKFGADAGKAGQYCIACHMHDTPAAGIAGHAEIGGHSFGMRSKDGATLHTQSCTKCHTVGATTSPRGQEFSVLARADYDGSGGAPQKIQDEVAGLLKLMGGAVTPTAGAPFGTNSAPRNTAPGAVNEYIVALARKVFADANPTSPRFAVGMVSSSGAFKMSLDDGSSVNTPANANGDILYKSTWNYFLTVQDSSYGIHNTEYTVSLLQASILEMHRVLGRAGSPPFVATGGNISQ